MGGIEVSELEQRLAVFANKQLQASLGEGFRSIGKGFVVVDRKATKESIATNALSLQGHLRYTGSMEVAMRVAVGCMLAEWLARNPHLDGDPVAAAVEMGMIDQSDRHGFDDINQNFKLATCYQPEDIMPGVSFGYYRKANSFMMPKDQGRLEQFIERRRELLRWVSESKVKIRQNDFYTELWKAYHQIMAKKNELPQAPTPIAQLRDELIFLVALRDGVNEGRWTEKDLIAKSDRKRWSLTMKELSTRLMAVRSEMENRKKFLVELEDTTPPWIEMHDEPDPVVVDAETKPELDDLREPEL